MPLGLDRMAPIDFLKSYQMILYQKKNFVIKMTWIVQKINLNQNKNPSIDVSKTKITASQRLQSFHD
jgi:hypothetical protein